MKLYSKSELKDSRIFFDTKPPYFLTIFIVFTLFLIVVIGIVSAVLPKSYIVEAQGTITSSDNTYVGALSDGVLIEMKSKEGDFVKQGDLLFTVSNGNEGLQYQALTNQVAQSKSKIEVMDKYTRSLNENTNYMQNSGIEQEYYSKVEYYLISLNDENSNTENTKKDIAKKTEKKVAKEAEITTIRDQLTKLTDSEEDKVKKEELNSSLESKITEQESLQSEIEQSQRGGSSQAYQTKLQLLSEVGTARTSEATKVVELEGQINAYQSQDSLYEVKANNDGFVHYLSPLKEGMAIQKTQTIAEISQNEESLMQVEAYINSQDISKVKQGNEVKIAVNGVNIQKYGTLKGKIEKIDIGTITQETSNGNLILYRCIISIKDNQMKASNGDAIKAIKSMPVVARIVYEKETYLDWVLGMLNFVK